MTRQFCADSRLAAIFFVLYPLLHVSTFGLVATWNECRNFEVKLSIDKTPQQHVEMASCLSITG